MKPGTSEKTKKYLTIQYGDIGSLVTTALVEQAMQLPKSERVQLISLLSDSLLTVEEKAIERQWAIVSEMRYSDFKAGKESTVDYSNIKRTRL
ncbi:MAG: addiction module protein [Spirochaetes bacterium]|nr:addiction module protein [Spirochaetota bacterium]